MLCLARLILDKARIYHYKELLCVQCSFTADAKHIYVLFECQKCAIERHKFMNKMIVHNFTTQPSLQWSGICHYVKWGPDSVRHKIKVVKLSYCRVVVLSGGEHATKRQHDTVHLSHYHVIAFSPPTTRQYETTVCIYRIILLAHWRGR